MMKISDLPNLPSMPVIAQDILAMLSNDELDIEDLADKIHQDPSLLARIVGLANSAYFGYANTIYTASDAIIKVLGLKTVSSLAFSIILSCSFDHKRCQGFSLQKYWHRALMTGIVAKNLSRLMPEKLRPSADHAYLCGLVHNLGQLALSHCYPEAMSGVFARHREDTELTLPELERLELGLTECEAGGLVARKWHLPESVATVMENCSDLSYADKDWPLTILIALSTCVAGQIVHESQIDIADEAYVRLGLDADRTQALIADLIEQNSGIAALANILSLD